MAQNLEDIRTLSFNSDKSCFTCCCQGYLGIFWLDPLQKLLQINPDKLGHIRYGEMSGNSNLLAIIMTKASCAKFDKTFVIDVTTNKELRFCNKHQDITSIKIRNGKMIIATTRNVYIYTFPESEFLAVFDSCININGLCDLTSSKTSEHQYLVFPSKKIGSVSLFNLNNIGIGGNSPDTHFISAHENGISCLVLNKEGNLLATTSKLGTIVRIWSTVTKDLIAELRRGLETANIYCLNFSQDSSLLCCSSDKGTIHIFKLHNFQTIPKRLPGSWSSVVGSVNQDRSIVKLRVSSKCRNICTILPNNTEVIVLCEDGFYCKYRICTRDSPCTTQVIDYQTIMTISDLRGDDF